MKAKIGTILQHKFYGVESEGWQTLAEVIDINIHGQLHKSISLTIIFNIDLYKLIVDDMSSRGSISYEILLEDYKMMWEGFISEMPIIEFVEGIQYIGDLVFEVDGKIEGDDVLLFERQEPLSFWKKLKLLFKR